MKIESQLSNGRWLEIAEDRRDQYLGRAARYQKTTVEAVTATLASGKTVKYGTDWYEDLRQVRVPVPPAPAPEKILCSCGHRVAAALVMRASLGTSCLDCYDRLSD